MPIVLDSHKAVSQARRLPFCYLCTQSFEAGDARNDDHVPPYALFAKEHRDFPLILPTHGRCNNDRSAEDQIISQLVGVLRGRHPSKEDRKMHLVAGQFPDGTAGVGALRLDLRAIIARWVRGFHAALYREPLAQNSAFMTLPPLQEGRAEGSKVVPVAPQPAAAEFVKELKRNRATQTLDRVVTRQGHCRYECVWTQADRGEWLCVWALDIYDWRQLGDISHFEAQGCVGCYRPTDLRVPAGATCATRLHFNVVSRERFDPFGS